MSLYDLQGAPVGLEAVVPGFRSLQGLGLVSGDGTGTQTPATMNCVPAGFESIVAMRCPDGSIMPACGSGTCGGSTSWPASVEELIRRITTDPTIPAPDNLGMRWGFFTVAAALLGVFVVYQELKHK